MWWERTSNGDLANACVLVRGDCSRVRRVGLTYDGLGLMFERMTDRGRRVVVLAQEEARMLNHDFIGTEHILLGLVREGEGVACKALESLGVDLDTIRVLIEEVIGEGHQEPTRHIPFTPRAKRVLELSLREALQLGHNYIGTEHVLLGLIREGEGVACQVLTKLGVGLTSVRQEVIRILSGFRGASDDRAPTPPSPKVQENVDELVRQVRVSLKADTVNARLWSEVSDVREERTHWVDVTSLKGNRMALNLDTISAMEEHQGCTDVYLGGNSIVHVKETIAAIWGEDAH